MEFFGSMLISGTASVPGFKADRLGLPLSAAPRAMQVTTVSRRVIVVPTGVPAAISQKSNYKDRLLHPPSALTLPVSFGSTAWVNITIATGWRRTLLGSKVPVDMICQVTTCAKSFVEAVRIGDPTLSWSRGPSFDANTIIVSKY